MTITGLSANLFWALLGGGAAAITILYLLKLRRRRVLVPFSPLWARVIEEREATSLLKKLKRFFSWLIQLLFVALLVLALADLRPTAESRQARYTAILIDASASMQATDEKPSRIEKAKAQARELVRNLGDEDQAMIVQVGAQATPLGSFTKEKSSLLAAVEQVQAADTSADLQRALETVTASLRGKPRPRIVLFTDGKMPLEGKVDLAGVEIQGRRVGRSGDNVGITSFNVRRYLASPGEYEAYLEIRNYADRPVTCNVTISEVLPGTCKATKDCPQGYECDRLLGACANPQGAIPPVSLEARGTWRRIVGNLNSDGGRLVATVEPREFIDPLPLDNRGYAYLSRRLPTRILVVTNQNLFLEALLLLDPRNVVSKVRPPEYRPTGEYDLTIFDGVAPDVHKTKGNFLYIAPTGAHSPFARLRGKVKAPAVETVKSKHPVLRWVALKDLNIVEALPLKAGKGDLVLVSGVGKGGKASPLVLARETPSGKVLAFAFDLKRSDLPLRWSFPILIPNIIAWMKDESREENSSVVTGRRWNIPVPRGVTKVEVVGPDGKRREAPVRDNRAQLFGTRAGFYQLFAPGEKRPLVTLAANLQDPGESDLRLPARLELAGKAVSKVTWAVVARRDLWVYLLLGALLLTALEWFSYHRRMTV